MENNFLIIWKMWRDIFINLNYMANLLFFHGSHIIHLNFSSLRVFEMKFRNVSFESLKILRSWIIRRIFCLLIQIGWVYANSFVLVSSYIAGTLCFVCFSYVFPSLFYLRFNYNDRNESVVLTRWQRGVRIFWGTWILFESETQNLVSASISF